MMLRYFNIWLSFGWAMVVALCYFSLISNPPEFNVEFKYFDKVRHFIAYFILMFWFSQLYNTNNARLFYVVFFIAMGAVLEVLQGIGGVRYFEYYDMLANSIGIAIAWLITKRRFNNLFIYVESWILK